MQLNSGEKDRVGAWEHGACFVLPMGVGAHAWCNRYT